MVNLECMHVDALSQLSKEQSTFIIFVDLLHLILYWIYTWFLSLWKIFPQNINAQSDTWCIIGLGGGCRSLGRKLGFFAHVQKRALKPIILTFLISLLLATHACMYCMAPRISILYFSIIESPAAQNAALRAGEVDVWTDIKDPAIIRSLEDDGFKVIVTRDGFTMCQIVFNMRRSPFDNVNFRHAVAHLVPKAEIEAVIFGGVIAKRLDTFVPPVLRKCYNPDVDAHPWNPAEAEVILTNAGIDPASVPTIIFSSPTEASDPSAYGTADLIVQNMQSIGLDVDHQETDFSALAEKVLITRDFDMALTSWPGLGRDPIDRDPDFLYQFFHSSQDVPGGYNLPGVADSELDALLEELHHSMSGETAATAKLVQDKLAELLPCVPVYTWSHVDAYRMGDPSLGDLEGVVKTEGYGSDNDWTFNLIHWTNQPIGSNLDWILNFEPFLLNPLFGMIESDWVMLDRIYDPLIAVEPYAHTDIPWVASNWIVEYSESEMNITFWLREDVYWHDGEPVNAEDVKFSWEFIRDYQIPMYKPMWENLVNVEVSASNVVRAYFNSTSPYYLYDLSDTALLLPEQIWQDVTDPKTFYPSQEDHPTVPGLTKLIGTGPYIYDPDSNPVLGGYIGGNANGDYYFMSPTSIEDLLLDLFYLSGDINRDGVVDIYDLSIAGVAYGSSEGDPRYNPYADLNMDDHVDIRDVIVICRNWGKQYSY